MDGYMLDPINNKKLMVRNVVGINGDMSLSDQNLKDNITVIPNALDKIKSLTGNTFKWKEGHPLTALNAGTDDVGIIAQEVEALGLAGITSTRNGYKSVSHKRLIPVMIEAIKELSAKVDALS